MLVYLAVPMIFQPTMMAMVAKGASTTGLPTLNNIELLKFLIKLNHSTLYSVPTPSGMPVNLQPCI